MRRAARWSLARTSILIVVSGLLFMVLVPLGLVDSWTSFISDPRARFAARTVALVAAVLVAIFAHKEVKAIVLSRFAPTSAPTNPQTFDNAAELRSSHGVMPTISEIESRTSVIHDRYWNEVIGLFATMLVDQRYWLRLEQQYSLTRGRVAISSRAQFVLSGHDRDRVKGRLQLEDAVTGPARAPRSAAPPTNGVEATDVELSTGDAERLDNSVLVVPLMRLRKGALLDDLEVTDAAGTRLVALSRKETLGILTEGLVGLFQMAFLKPGSSEAQRFQRELARERKAFEEMFSKNAKGDPVGAGRDQLMVHLRDLQRLISIERVIPANIAGEYFDSIAEQMPDRNPERTRSLRDFCVFFAGNYILAVEVPLPSGFYLSINYQNSASLVPTSESFIDRLRAFFGLSPFRYRLPIDSTRMFPSCHVELDGRSRRQYILYQSVMVKKNGDLVEAAGSDLGGDTLRIRNDSGRAFPHLHYVSAQPRLKPRRLVWEVRLAEIPPGALGPVFAMSVAVTFILMAFTFTAPLFKDADLDAPALTIAVPIFALTLFGYTFDRLVRSSLLAAVGFLVNAALALGAAVALLTFPGQYFVPPSSRLFGHQYHSLLLAATVLSATLAVCLFSAWRIRLADFSRRKAGTYDIKVGGLLEGDDE